MAEKLQEQLQKEFQRMGDNVDRQHIRPLQKAAYLCMAKCFDNPKASLESVQACTQRCEQRLQAVNHVVQEEVNTFQHLKCFGDCVKKHMALLPGIEARIKAAATASGSS